MRDHALIGKFLGLWPSEKDLTHWIKAWWNPKGEYELQLSSKGFFIVIFYNLEDKDKILKGGHISTIRLASTSASGQTVSTQKRKTSHTHRYGFASIPYLKSSG
jgi:hypothetical protein